MATQVVMPKLSPTMEEGQLARWFKKEGDTVSVGEPMFEVDTDKATMEAQALASGVLRKILVKEGESVPLGEMVAIIGEADEDISELLGKAKSGAAGAENNKSIKESVESGEHGAQQELANVVVDGARTQETIKGAPLKGDTDNKAEDKAAVQKPTDGRADAASQTPNATDTTAQAASASNDSGNGSGGDKRVIISPLAARMAAEAGINLQTLNGTGPGGRIVKRDIESAISSGATQTTQPASQSATIAQTEATKQTPSEEQAVTKAQTAPQFSASQIESASPYRDEPLSEMRRVIARRLTSSIGPVPHFFLTTEIEMDKAIELRQTINALEPETKISLNDLIIKVAAHALVQHPQVNASFQEKSVRYYERADIGVAVAIDDGLITPVIRAANQKSVGQIAREVRELAERARARRLKPEEYTGATFSVSNLGMFGIDEFTAVINPPEAAIIAVGASQPKAVVRENQVVVRQMMRVTMSCDHRAIDGATGAKFLQTFKKVLENPTYLLV